MSRAALYCRLSKEDETAGPGGEQSAPTSGKRGSANDKNASTIDKNGRGGRARRETEKEAMA